MCTLNITENYSITILICLKTDLCDGVVISFCNSEIFNLLSKVQVCSLLGQNLRGSKFTRFPRKQIQTSKVHMWMLIVFGKSAILSLSFEYFTGDLFLMK